MGAETPSVIHSGAMLPRCEDNAEQIADDRLRDKERILAS
jgi:hypothetical protein